LVAVTVAVAFVLGGGLGYAMASNQSSVEELAGRASVGSHVASIQVGDRFYGVSESVAWIDASGSYHDDGWPDCLGPAGTTSTVRFGAEDVELPDGGGFTVVVYVDCSP
jgi:hypothetical protein